MVGKHSMRSRRRRIGRRRKRQPEFQGSREAHIVMESDGGKTTMLIEGYQVFREDQATNIVVKQEPPDVEIVKIQPGRSSDGPEPTCSNGPEHGRSQVTDSTISKDYERERLIQDYNWRKKNELTVSAVVENLVKKNAMLLTELDASAKKHIPKKTPLIQDFMGNCDEPKDAINHCITKDLTLSNINETIVESSVDESTDPEFICAVGSQVNLSSTQGQKLVLDVKCYWCNFCNFKTGDMNLLLKHLVQHRFQCKYCNYESFSRASVVQHCNKTHERFKEFSSTLKFCSFLPHIVDKNEHVELDKDAKRKREDKEEIDEENRNKRKKDIEPGKDEEASRYQEAELLSMEVDEVGESGEISSALKDKIIIPSSVKKNLPAPETAPTLNETQSAIKVKIVPPSSVKKNLPAPETALTLNETRPGVSSPSSSLTEETELLVSSSPTSSSQDKDCSLPVISCVVSGEKAVAEAEKMDESRSEKTKQTKSSGTTTEAATLTSGLCWSCGYCELVTLSQALLKIHLTGSHPGKPHKYVALLARSKEEMEKIRQADTKLSTKVQKENNPSRKTENKSVVPAESNIMDIGSTNNSRNNAIGPKVPHIVKILTTNSSDNNSVVPKESNIIDPPSTNISGDGVSIQKVSSTVNTPSTDSSGDSVTSTCTTQGSSTANNVDETEVEKQTPLFYKCAHCNYSSEDVERVKAHLMFRHMGSVMYILDMKAIRLRKKRYLFFCLKNLCNFMTKERQEYSDHLDKCIPVSSAQDLDSGTMKSMVLTKQFIGKTWKEPVENNLKSGKEADYVCLYCDYVSENNTRVKKHVLNNHKTMPTKIRNLNNQKRNVTFCCHCLWETYEEKELGIHLAENHDDNSLVNLENVIENSEDTDSSVQDVPDKQNLDTSAQTEKLTSTQSNQSFSNSGKSVLLEDKISDCVEEERYIEIIGKTAYNKALAAYIASEDRNGQKGKARPTRNAAMKAQIKTKLLKLPTLLKCYHCQDHLAFGIKLMKNHIKKEHNSLPMITYNLLKLEQNHMQALVYICPHEICPYTAAFATDVINHARKYHRLQPTNPQLVLLSSITPPTSLNSTRVRRATAATGESYECLYCTVSVINHSRRDMKKHLLDEHPQEEFLYRDCIARKLRQQSRYYMCHEMTCDFTCAGSKDYSLHLLAHKKSTIYECPKCAWFSADEAAVKTHMDDEHNGENISILRIDLDLNSRGQLVKLVDGTEIKSEIA